METRVAIMGIIVENTESVQKLNNILHEYGEYIFGRMGIPYKEKRINVLSVAVDAPQDIISTMAGRIGKLDGISVKTAYSNVISDKEN
jgi:putative iron-only hydrogenase system regulator